VGNSIEDSILLLSSFEFNKEKIIPIIIGGSQDLTFALYRSFDELEQMVNLVYRQ
jgi:hypothetical protein